eukprot:8105-Pyramimonas_sp.AAC.1
MHHCSRPGCTSPPARSPAPVPQAPDTSSPSSAPNGISMDRCLPKTTLHVDTPPTRVAVASKNKSSQDRDKVRRAARSARRDMAPRRSMK